jgi:hypothetical protein
MSPVLHPTTSKLVIIHDNGVFQADLGKNVPDAVLGELLEVIGRCSAAKNDAFGLELDIQIANAPAGAGVNLPLKFVL